MMIIYWWTKNAHLVFWNVASITTWVSPNESREFFPATDVCKLGLEWFLSFQLRENCGSLTFSGDPQSFIIGFLEMSFLLLLPRIMLHHIWIELSIIEFLVFSHVHHFSSPKELLVIEKKCSVIIFFWFTQACFVNQASIIYSLQSKDNMASRCFSLSMFKYPIHPSRIYD